MSYKWISFFLTTVKELSVFLGESEVGHRGVRLEFGEHFGECVMTGELVSYVC